MEKLGKHNHKLTNILKVAIFSLVMLAPIGAVLSKVAYITFNKNAYESYYGETINQQKLHTANFYNVINNLTYTIPINQEAYAQSNNEGVSYFTSNEIEIGQTKYNTSTYRIGFYNTANNKPNVYIRDLNDIEELILGIRIDNQQMADIKFNITSQHITQDFYNYLNIQYIEYNKYSYMDNAFYYACNQLTQEPLFNWTINTGTYTAINAMFTGLGMQSNHPLAICLCYWMICTMIYIVIDIVIFCITKLTHITNDE